MPVHRIQANLTINNSTVTNPAIQATSGIQFETGTGRISTEQKVREVKVVTGSTAVYNVNATTDGAAIINAYAAINQTITINLPAINTWFNANILADKTTSKAITVLFNGEGSGVILPNGSEKIDGRSEIKLQLFSAVFSLIAVKDLQLSTDTVPVYEWKVIANREGESLGTAVTIGYGNAHFNINPIRSTGTGGSTVFTDDCITIQKAVVWAAKNGYKRIVLQDLPFEFRWQIGSTVTDYQLEISELAAQGKFLAENYHAQLTLEGSSRNTTLYYVNNFKQKFFDTKYFDLLHKSQPTQTELQILGQARPRGGSYKITIRNLLFKLNQYGTGYNGSETGNTATTDEYEKFSAVRIYGCNYLLENLYFDDAPDFCIITDYQKFDWAYPKRNVNGTYTSIPDNEKELVENYIINCWSQRHGRGFGYGVGHDARLVNVTGWSFKPSNQWHLRLKTDDNNVTYPLLAGDTAPSGSAGAGLSAIWKGAFTDGGTRWINCHFYGFAALAGYMSDTIFEAHTCEFEGKGTTAIGNTILGKAGIWFDGNGCDGSKLYNCNVYYCDVGIKAECNSFKIVMGMNAVTNTIRDCMIQVGSVNGQNNDTRSIGSSGYDIEIYGNTTNSTYPDFVAIKFVNDNGGTVKTNCFMNAQANYIGGTMNNNTKYDFRFTGGAVGANLSNPALGDWVERKDIAHKANVYRHASVSNPSPVNGDVWYDPSTTKFSFREGGVTKNLATAPANQNINFNYGQGLKYNDVAYARDTAFVTSYVNAADQLTLAPIGNGDGRIMLNAYNGTTPGAALNRLSVDKTKTTIHSFLNIIPSAADPATTVDGDIWINSTTNTIKAKLGGVVRTITTT